MKKTILLILTVAVLLSYLSFVGVYAEKQSSAGIKIAYIPIDNRPVNYDRVRFLAQAAGIELLMPKEEYFRTALDNMTPNLDGSKTGNRQELMKWLKQIDGECDYFVISLDQMLSGGLVASRAMSNTDLSFEYSVADYIISLAENNTVVLFDTIMRLASTVDFNGYKLAEYNALRSYGAVERKLLTGSELTAENIVSGYAFDKNGNKIASSLSDRQIADYLACRTRKLKLADYILGKSLDSLEYCYIGVDDSVSGNCIQTNEINYIKNKAGGKSTTFGATDELGLMGITRIMTKLYGKADVEVHYYGGKENEVADAFNYETLKGCMESHILSLGCEIVEDNPDIEVLVFTNCHDSNKAIQLINRVKANLKNKVPTIIIDPNLCTHDTVFISKLAASNLPLAEILGFSYWNTAGNSVGIALSNGISRYLYLKNAFLPTNESHIGFLKTITFSYLKDISYKGFCYSISDPNASGNGSYADLLEKLNKSTFITSLNGYETSLHEEITVSNFRLPWNRAFEMTFDIDVPDMKSPDISMGDVNGDGDVTVTDYIMVRLHILGVTHLGQVERLAADMNGDEKITADDYIQLKKIILRIEKQIK